MASMRLWRRISGFHTSKLAGNSKTRVGKILLFISGTAITGCGVALYPLIEMEVI